MTRRICMPSVLLLEQNWLVRPEFGDNTWRLLTILNVYESAGNKNVFLGNLKARVGFELAIFDFP